MFSGFTRHAVAQIAFVTKHFLLQCDLFLGCSPVDEEIKKPLVFDTLLLMAPDQKKSKKYFFNFIDIPSN